MSRQAAHPAFPPIPGASGTRSLPPVPTTPSDFRNLINGCDTPQSIHECLVPLLQQISEGKGQSGTSKDKVARGEELLSMPDEDLSRLQDAAVTSLAAALVYIV